MTDGEEPPPRRDAIASRDEIPASFAARFGGLALTTMALRGLGLASQMVIAATFGAGAGLDAFFIALVAPMLVWVPATATLELIVAPRYQRAWDESGEVAEGLRNGLLTAMAFVGIGLSVTLSLASPLLVQVLAPAASDDAVDLAADLGRIINAGVGLRLVGAAIGAMLIARRRIFSMTVVRGVNSAALVVAVLLGGSNPAALAWGTLAGDTLELVLLMALLVRTDGRLRFRPRARIGLFTAETMRLHLALVTVNLVPAIDTAFLSGLSAGAITVFALSVRLADATKSVFLLPNARIAVADAAGIETSIAAIVRRTTAVGLLAAVSLALGGPILLFTVYRTGEFTTADAQRALPILLTLCVGLLASAYTYVFPRLLIALHDGQFVTRSSALVLVSNLALDAVLIGPFGATGVATASVLTVGIVGVLQYRRVRTLLRQHAEAPADHR